MFGASEQREQQIVRVRLKQAELGREGVASAKNKQQTTNNKQQTNKQTKNKYTNTNTNTHTNTKTNKNGPTDVFSSNT